MRTIIGLTGPTGSGKSTFSLIASKTGVKVIDCDKVAREAVLPGSDGLKALVNTFGEDILDLSGNLNRKALANIAFSDKEHTELLNKTLLPFIVKLIKKKITGDKVLLDAPTLFESGIDEICYKTVAVLSDSENRLKRIIERDNLNIEDAKIRLNAGKPDSFYKEKADFILYNDTDLSDFSKKSKQIIKNVFERK